MKRVAGWLQRRLLRRCCVARRRSRQPELAAEGLKRGCDGRAQLLRSNLQRFRRPIILSHNGSSLVVFSSLEGSAGGDDSFQSKRRRSSAREILLSISPHFHGPELNSQLLSGRVDGVVGGIRRDLLGVKLLQPKTSIVTTKC
jgi:hypothetical protein